VQRGSNSSPCRFAQHGVGGRGLAQALLFHAHAPQHLERRHQEVPRAAAGVHHRHLGGAPRPAGKDPGGGRPVVPVTQVVVPFEQRAVRAPRRPPGAERVFEQEAHHVVLGEELRHRRQFGRPDLAPALVDPFFLLTLPELIDPAEGVVGREDRGGQRAQDALQPVAPFRGEADGHGGIVGAEDAGKHGAGVARGQRPGVLGALIGGEFGALFQRHGDAERPVYQQAILGQEAREEHAVPLRVGDFLDQRRHARGYIVMAAELARPRAQAVAQTPVGERQRVERSLIDGEGVEGGAGRVFGLAARLGDGAFERLAQGSGQ